MGLLIRYSTPWFKCYVWQLLSLFFLTTRMKCRNCYWSKYLSDKIINPFLNTLFWMVKSPNFFSSDLSVICLKVIEIKIKLNKYVRNKVINLLLNILIQCSIYEKKKIVLRFWVMRLIDEMKAKTKSFSKRLMLTKAVFSMMIGKQSRQFDSETVVDR